MKWSAHLDQKSCQDMLMATSLILKLPSNCYSPFPLHDLKQMTEEPNQLKNQKCDDWAVGTGSVFITKTLALEPKRDNRWKDAGCHVEWRWTEMK